MGNMDYFYKKWYKLNDDNKRESLYNKRFNSESAIRLGLFIHPLDQSQNFELYYIPTNEMILKIDKIYFLDQILQSYSRMLPGVAKDAFLFDIISEELFSSNELEGVKSSKREIAESAKKIAAGKNLKNARMHSMIKSYFKLQDGSIDLPKIPQDVRTMYDYITEGEIDEINLPDGDIFITEGAEVAGTGYGKIIHRGVYGEKNITGHIEKLLNFLQRDDLPMLIKLAIAHYYFGYIHPFYDGNGRTSRFIASLYLSQFFSIYTAYSVSIGCRLEHKKYLELFDKTNKFNSYGEMNFEIDTFLDILLSGQKYVVEKMQEKKSLLDKADDLLKEDNWLNKEENLLAQEIVFLFCQAYFFADNVLSRSEVVDIAQEINVKLSKNEIYRNLDEIEKRKYIIKTKGRPIEYILNKEFVEQSREVDDYGE